MFLPNSSKRISANLFETLQSAYLLALVIYSEVATLKNYVKLLKDVKTETKEKE